jgi:putative transposase
MHCNVVERPCRRQACHPVSALAEMSVQGVSTRKVKAISEELCGHSLCAAAISAITLKLDQGLAGSARRRLDEAGPHLVLDARYGRVRDAGVSRSQAVLLAIAINAAHCPPGAPPQP